MEAVVVLSSLVCLALASSRWGRDSRDGPRSKEQELASYGFSWPAGRDQKKFPVSPDV